VSKIATVLEQLRDQPDHELQQALVRARDELFRLHLAQHTNQVTSTAEVTEKRREIARILTILRARALGSEAQGQKFKNAQQAQKAEMTETAKP
jgi:large subunit ribosomal protein L29